MKIAVLVKQVPDPNVVRLDPRLGDIQPGTPRVPNEYDLYAMEAGVRLAERIEGCELVVASAGPAKDTLNRCLAMGADRAVAIQDVDARVDSLATATILAAWLTSEGADVVLAGQETSDGATGNVGPQVAALLGLPVVSNVVALEYEDGRFTVTREIEDGHQVVRVGPPVVLCALSGLSEPRYPSLKGIMAARRKPTEAKALADLGVTLESTGRVSWGRLFVEEETAGGIIIRDEPADQAVEKLVAFLRERKLI